MRLPGKEHKLAWQVTAAIFVSFAVITILRLIFSFIDNPFFKEISVVDTQVTTKARRDLEEIIELSEQIKRDSEKLRISRQP